MRPCSSSRGHGSTLHHPGCIIRRPNRESGRNQWWRFRRADGSAWGLAGLWGTWTDKATGEIVESYTMLTMNADSPPAHVSDAQA